MKHGVVGALLVLLAAAIAVYPARAGGPEPSARSFGVQTKLSGQLAVTVTDHGPTCGLAANSTATWVLRAQSGGTQHVLCARNDNGSSIDFPMCDGSSQPALRCSTNQGGVQGMSESTLDLFGDLARWMQFKLYPQTIATVLDGAAVSVTVMANGCQTLMPNGQILSCASDADCVQTCDLGFCTGNAFNVSCTTNSDCNFGTCLLQGVTQLDFTDGTTNANKGTRADYSLTLGFTPGVTDQGTCGGLACFSDPGLACQSNATCVSTCDVTLFSCNNDPSVSCSSDQNCNFGSCVRSCSNDHTVVCASDTDCNLVINVGNNVPVMQDAACAGVQCGDGYVDPGEQCDDGPLNGTAQSPSGCSCSCTLPTTTTTTTTSTTHSTSTSTSTTSTTKTTTSTSSSTSTSTSHTTSTSTSTSSSSTSTTSTSTSTTSTSTSSSSSTSTSHTTSTSSSSSSTSTTSTSTSTTSTSTSSSTSTSTTSTSSSSTSTSSSSTSTSSASTSSSSTSTASTSSSSTSMSSSSTSTSSTSSTSSSTSSTSSTSTSSTSTASTSTSTTSTSTSSTSITSTSSSSTSTTTIFTTSTTSTSTSVTTTTSTSITAPLPTTTTLPATCQEAATFESIDCRLDALTARIIAASDVGGIRAGLLLQLGNARTRKEQAETLLAQGKTGKVRAALRHAIASMMDFGARVTSPAGRRQIGRGTRQAIAQQGKAIMRDLQKLLQSQAAKTPRTAVVSR